MDRVLRRLAEARPFDVPPRPAPDRARPSRKPILLPAGALAAIVAVVAAMTLTGGGRTPAGDTDAIPVQAKDARQVLLAAATQTSAAAQATGRYWLQTAEHGTVYDLGDYKILGRAKLESRVPTSAQDSYVSCAQWLGFQPLTDADRAAWQRAGSPSEVDVDHRRPTRHLTVGPGQRECKSRPADNQFYIGGGLYTYQEIQALPTQPAPLRQALTQKMEQADPDMMFFAVIDLVMRVPAPAAVRAAAYRMAADLPGVGLEENVTDILGRTGNAVSHAFQSWGQTAMRVRVIIDPATGQTLTYEQQNAAPDVQLSAYEAITESTYTDQSPPSA